MINIMKSDKVEFIKLKDIKVGDVFYLQDIDNIPYLKTTIYVSDFTNRYDEKSLIGVVNLTNGEITEFSQSTYVKLYKKIKLTIEV